ncbi:spermidine/putrescine ABC transporter permease [Marinitoga sp. 1135]|uniref:carbohydrate ABC transporter permease n=1 Tax=unclassified Marinitoga TaxID=2640159 RepID=UPI0009503BB0|nr:MULTISPECIES: sugar ABC transporter permease [unclassified Marinitoga]APT75999.1 spermidine/putrescine ABC transporter permease [Marinitoga sp. 1137]NUU95743.1 spermidine/putrescine ABC transporter permease [Marinitoga sp. 1135]
MKKSKKELLKGIVFISPWLIGFIVFTLIPFVASFFYSFTRFSITTDMKWIGFENYINIMKDPIFWKCLKNTLVYAIGLVPLGLIVALGMAFLLNKPLKEVSFYRAAIYMPSIVPAFAFSAVVTWFFQPYLGLVNNLLDLIGIEGPLWLSSEKWVKPTIIIAAQWGVGSAMLIFSAALKDIPKELYESAKIDGAGSFTMFRKITLPLITPTILYYLITSTIGALQIFDLPMLLTGGGPANASLSLSIYIYKHAFTYTNMGYASALAWILFGLTLILTIIYFITSKRWVFYFGK